MNPPVETEFDPVKDAENRRNHGVSLALGASVLAGAVGEVEDTRRNYGEARFRAYGYVEGRLFACVYTPRGRVRRIISVHPVRPKEMKKWLAST